jgi:hypothetical protein
MQRLSSGSRINGASDDPAGLAISTSLSTQIRSIAMAVRNTTDYISLLQVADGACIGIVELLQRGRELAVQSSNGTLSQSDRFALNQEALQIKDQINNIAQNTSFNGIKLLDGSYTQKKFQIGPNSTDSVNLSIPTLGIQDSSRLPSVTIIQGVTAVPEVLGKTAETTITFSGLMKAGDQITIGDLIFNCTEDFRAETYVGGSLQPGRDLMWAFGILDQGWTNADYWYWSQGITRGTFTGSFDGWSRVGSVITPTSSLLKLSSTSANQPVQDLRKLCITTRSVCLT